MKKVRLLLRYDGTGFSGWQVQPGRVTIQGLVEAGVERITGGRTRVLAAGRTDAGVHALHQVASFGTDSHHPPEVFQRALNGMLPEAIRVCAADYAPDDFHPRYSAKAKRYFYLIDCSAQGNPFAARYSYHYRWALDRDSMARAASFLVGRHDFSSFRAAGCGAKTTVREIFGIEVEETERLDFLTVSLGGPFIRITIEADAFLRHMVRNITGTLIDVGRGRLAPADVKAILEARDRRLAGPTVPGRGLFLEKVYY